MEVFVGLFTESVFAVITFSFVFHISTGVDGRDDMIRESDFFGGTAKGAGVFCRESSGMGGINNDLASGFLDSFPDIFPGGGV